MIYILDSISIYFVRMRTQLYFKEARGGGGAFRYVQLRNAILVRVIPLFAKGMGNVFPLFPTRGEWGMKE